MSDHLVRLIADRDRCVGAGQCVLSAPHVFDQSDQDGRVLILPTAALSNAAPPSSALASPMPPSSVLATQAPPNQVPTNPAPAGSTASDATLPNPGLPHPEGPLVAEDIARAAVDLCPSGALSLARR